MNPEKPYSEEELKQLSERALSDADLIRSGAEYVNSTVEPRLDITEKQHQDLSNKTERENVDLQIEELKRKLNAGYQFKSPEAKPQRHYNFEEYKELDSSEKELIKEDIFVRFAPEGIIMEKRELVHQFGVKEFVRLFLDIRPGQVEKGLFRKRMETSYFIHNRRHTRTDSELKSYFITYGVVDNDEQAEEVIKILLDQKGIPDISLPSHVSGWDVWNDGHVALDKLTDSTGKEVLYELIVYNLTQKKLDLIYKEPSERK